MGNSRAALDLLDVTPAGSPNVEWALMHTVRH
jgi:hypothetical protein